MIMVISEAYLTANLFSKALEMLLGLHKNRNKNSPAAESKSNETCLGNWDYDFVISLIDNDVFASQ